MNKRLKIYLLFLILSITPFIGGCGESYGFPFPAIEKVISPGLISDTIRKLFEAFKSLDSFLFLAIDILFAILVVHYLIRTEKYKGWFSSCLNALAIHLAAVWFMFFLLLAKIEQPLLKEAIESYGVYFGSYFFDIPRAIADNLDKIIYSTSSQTSQVIGVFIIIMRSLQLQIIDITSRAWFVIVTFLLGTLIYGIKKLLKIIKVKNISA